MAIGKKSDMDMSAVVKLILAIAVFVILLVFSTNFLGIVNQSASDAKCRLTVLGQTNKIMGKGLISLNCPRHEIKITDTNVQMQDFSEKDKWKNIKTLNPRLAEDKKQFYKVAADEMADCWFKMGEGKMNVFNKDVFFKSRAPCVICSHIQFDKGGAATVQLGTTKEFVNYLNTTNYTKNGYNKPYYDYMLMEYPAQYSGQLTTLFYMGADNSIYMYGFDNDPSLNNDDNYVVFFKAYKYTMATNALKSTGTSIAGIFNKLVSEQEPTNQKAFKEKYDGNYYIFLAKPENVPKVCSVIIN